MVAQRGDMTCPRTHSKCIGSSTLSEFGTTAVNTWSAKMDCVLDMEIVNFYPTAAYPWIGTNTSKMELDTHMLVRAYRLGMYGRGFVNKDKCQLRACM